MRILIVEDEIHLAEALTQILRKNNYSVDVAYDGEVGLDNALSNTYDVIILDIMLPKVDGITILKEIRKEEISTPVILLTARGDAKQYLKAW
jgi:two-component system response regulator ArlR